MAEIKAIRPLRYTKAAGVLADNVCPPYDIISDSERKALIDGSEFNLVRLEKPEGDDRYNEAAKLLDKWLEDGILKRDEEEGIFVYSEEFSAYGQNYVFSGIICLCKLYPFSDKVVLPHEETLSKAKADRFELMKTTFCNFSSIYSLYLDEEGTVPSIIAKVEEGKPEQEFTDGEGVTHKLWKISDKTTVDTIINALAPKQFFIADGHHRYETGLNFRNYLAENGLLEGTNGDYIMMTLVDMDNEGLVIFPTHRLIRDMEIDKKALLAKCAADFEITEMDDVKEVEKVLDRYKDRHAYGLYTGGEGFTLLVKKEEMPDIGDGGLSALDVSVLHNEILEKQLGIDKVNMANQVNLTYTRVIDEAIESVKSGVASAAFILNPTKVSEIKNVSLAGGKMPQKSTYFYPKLKTGLLINTITER